MEFLSNHGFDIQDLHRAYNMAGLKFSVDHSRSFGEESMNYRLNFSWDHQFDNYRWDGYKATYCDRNGNEKSQGFVASYVGIANATLAYQVLSGKLEDIREKLMETGIEQFTAADINAFLETTLSQNPETFTFHASKTGKEGFIDFDIDVTKVDQYYEPSDIQATFIRFPDIEHSIINGVDTEKLLARMAAIDWEQDHLYEFDGEGLAEPTAETRDIFDAMELLLRDEKGKDIARNLQLRHWLDVPYFDAFVQNDTWKLYQGLLKEKFSFPLDTGAQQIYNLMCGRPVITGRLIDIPDDFDKWQQLVHSNHGLTMATIEGPSRRELETYLTMLPLDAMYRDILLGGLFRGDVCKITLYGLQQTEVLLSVDFGQKSLKISTLEGKIIPYNFKLEQAQEPISIPEKSRIQHTPAVMKKKKKRRGKGL